MNAAAPGTMLRPAPPRDRWTDSAMGRFLEQAEQRTGRSFPDYDAAWAWSVEDLEGFWAAVWEHFDVLSDAPYETVLRERRMPRAEWFPGARISYTEHVVRRLREREADIMVKSRSQTSGSLDWTGARLLEEIGRIQAGLVRAGVAKGDRVVGYLPNIPQTVAAYLAAAGLGAVWISVPPEMGPRSVLDRITQVEPSLLIAIDGYRWGPKGLSRADDLARIRSFLPEVPVVLLPYLDEQAQAPDGAIPWSEFTAEPGEIRCERVPFDHPLTILFSSGTTGRPKAIVHSHGGLLLEHLKAMGLHFDVDRRDTLFFFSTTGWMVWTLSVSALLMGAAVVLEDADPNWPALDGEWSQWAVLAETEATYYATGAAYLAVCAHSGLRPGSTWDLSRVREIQCSGSPLAADVAAWVYEAVSPDVLLAPTSGGTDICAAFVGGSPLTPVWAGEMSCLPLGVSVEAWDPEGRPVAEGEPGELVATLPMPSMPVCFWGDEDDERYLASYFGAYEGVWRHGDWLIRTQRGSWVITGRSDATLNRGGVRLGTAEFYAVLDVLPEIRDSMVMHFEGDGMGKLILLVDADADVDREALERRIRTTIRTELSPRHVPDHVVFVDSIPRNPNGKRLEIPLKRIIQGALKDEVVDPGAVVRSEDLDETTRRVRLVLDGR